MLSDSSIAAKVGLTQRANVILLVANLIGASLYVWRSSFSWAIPQEKGLNSTTGEPFIWALAVIPVVAVALLVNVPWGVMILRRRQWDSGRLWLLVGIVWLAAIAVDFAHH
jgi:hypothetical protein